MLDIDLESHTSGGRGQCAGDAGRVTFVIWGKDVVLEQESSSAAVNQEHALADL